MAWNPFSSSMEESILKAISAAEAGCSGEIRIHVDKYCKGDPVYKASNLFFHFEMEQTETRNGVLIYVAVKDHKFSIIGDEGIDKKVSSVFWEQTKDLMMVDFKTGDIPSGIITGIQCAGIQLAKYFPIDKDDKKELTNDASHDS